MNKLTSLIVALTGFIQALAVRIEFKPSVDGVMAQFTKTIDRLDQVAEHHADHDRRKTEAAFELLNQANDHGAESQRATETARKLRSLIV